MAIPYFLDTTEAEFDEWIVPDPLITKITDRLASDLKAACVHMDAAKLTDDQKVAVAMHCGVKWECRIIPPDGRVGSWELKITTDPCAITVQDGKWCVYAKENSA